MSKRVTYDLRSPDRAKFVFDSLHERCTSAGAGYDGNLLRLSPVQVGLLAALPEDHDGHIDADGRMWIGGSEFPLAPDQHEGNAREHDRRRNVWQAWCSCGFEGDEHGTGNRADDEAARQAAMDELDRHHTRVVDLWLAAAPARKG